MNVEFQVNDGSKPSKPRFVFEDHNDFIKREPIINEELKISIIDLDEVKTEQDEPNQNEENDLNIPIETKFNLPIENQEAKVLETFAPNTAEIKYYSISTSENSDNPIVPEVIENNLPNKTENVEIKTETLEPIAEVDVKEHIIFEPLSELDIKEHIKFEPLSELDIQENIVVKSEENVVKQSLGIEGVTDSDNLKIGKSVFIIIAKKEINPSTPIVTEDTNKIKCMYCDLKVKDLIQLAIHTHNAHYKSQYSLQINKTRYVKQQQFKVCDHCEYQTKRKANLVQHIYSRHMPKDKKAKKKPLKYTCNFCDKKFATKGKMYEHSKTHDGKRSSCKSLLGSLKVYAKAPRTKSFACNLCKHIACTGGALKYHMAKFHNLKSIAYHCHHCQSSFTQKDHLIAHLKLQSDNYTSDYKCPYKNKNHKYGKGFMYDYNTYLTKGGKKNIGNYKTQVKSYECTTCPFKCTKRDHLKAHLIKHVTMLAKKPAPVEKSYSCQFCKFKSANEKILNKHLRKNHQQLEPYFCKLCDCKYSVMNDLVKHIKVTHFVRKK